MSISLLLVEDDAELSGSLADYLSEVGFEVDFAFNGKSCLSLVEENNYEVIVMDVAMPMMDGFSACRILREERQLDTPILFLTARDTLDDKLEGFDAGCDDYLVKPFAPEELVCRLQALLKRGRGARTRRRELGELELDLDLELVYRQGKPITLHDAQFKLLVLLAEAAPKPVSRAVLEKKLWPDELPESDPLRTHMYRLRQQIDKPFDKQLLHTVHGKGYRLAIPE